jgi:hypothetical protein
MTAMETLTSVRLMGRKLYVNNNPCMPYLLPLSNGWTVNELAENILRACAEYNVDMNWDGAVFLARSIAKEAINDTLKGGYELGWD